MKKIFFLGWPFFVAFATGQNIDQLQNDLNKIIEQYDMSVKANPSDKALKEQAEEIRKKEEELKKAVEEHNKKVKEDFERKKSETQKEMPSKETLKNVEEPPVKEEKKESSVSDMTPKDIQALKDENKNLKEKVEQLTTTIADIKNDLKDMKDILQKKVQDKPKIKGQKLQQDIKKSEQKENTVEPFVKKEFDEIVKIFEKTPEKSITLFEEFAYEHKRELIAIDAHLKIAEAYMQLAKWDLANRTLQNVLANTKLTVYQNVEALLLLADSQRNQNDREMACKTLADLERSNLPMTDNQNKRYQMLIVASDCSSKLDKDIKNAE